MPAGYSEQGEGRFGGIVVVSIQDITNAPGGVYRVATNCTIVRVTSPA